MISLLDKTNIVTRIKRACYIILVSLLSLALLAGCLSSESPSYPHEISQMNEEELRTVAEDTQHRIVNDYRFPIGTAATWIVKEDRLSETYNKSYPPVGKDGYSLRIETDDFVTKGEVYRGRPAIQFMSYPPPLIGWNFSGREKLGTYRVDGYPVGRKMLFEQNEEKYRTENVTPEAGKNYDIGLGNRSEWTYQKFQDEAREIVLSDVESVEVKRVSHLDIHLNPDKETVTEYIEEQHTALTGRGNWSIPQSDIEDVDARLAVSVYINSSGNTKISDILGLYVTVSTDDPYYVGGEDDFFIQSLYKPVREKPPGQVPARTGG